MQKENKEILQVVVIAVVGIAAYRYWKNTQETSSFSNARGRKSPAIRGQGRSEPGWGHSSFIKVCEDAGGNYDGDENGNGWCHNLPPGAPNPLPQPLTRKGNVASSFSGSPRNRYLNKHAKRWLISHGY